MGPHVHVQGGRAAVLLVTNIAALAGGGVGGGGVGEAGLTDGVAFPGEDWPREGGYLTMILSEKFRTCGHVENNRKRKHKLGGGPKLGTSTSHQV